MPHSSFDSHAGESRLIALDPRIKLAAFLVITVTTALLVRAEAVVASLGFALIISAYSGLPARHLSMRMAGILPFAGVAFLSVLPFSGWVPAMILLVRIMACVTYLIVLSSTTPFFDLIRAFQFFHLPSILTQMLIFLYRYLFVFSEESRRMQNARKARGYGNLSFTGFLNKNALRIIALSAGMILYRAYRRGMAVNRALTSRCYDGKMRTLTEFKVRTPDVLLLAYSGATAILLIFIQLGGIAG